MRSVSSPAEAPEVSRYHIVDLVLAPPDAPAAGNPFDVPFAATFWGPEGQAFTIPGYYDAEAGYVVRFSPTVEGAWRYAVSSAAGFLDGVGGAVRCTPHDHPRLHGPLMVDPAYRHHFCFEDGTRCYLVGYEVNWLMMVDQSPSDLTRIDALLDSIQGVGFNMVTVNAYAHHFMRTPEREEDARLVAPDLAPWVGGNEAPDYSRFDAAFFSHYDRVMLDLLDRGILAHIMIQVYNKHVNWPELGSLDDDRFWRYVVARYQAFCNVIWDTAKESYYQPAEYVWSRIGLIRDLDGYRRLLTVHDASVPHWPHSERNARLYAPTKRLSDAMADFKSDQIHEAWYEDAERNYTAAQRPYVNIEYGYEQGAYDLPTGWARQDWREVLRRTWLVTMGGAYPNYYFCNTAWDLFLPTPEPPGYAPHRLYIQFWQDTRYWLLAPNPAPLGPERASGTYCRAAEGQEYVVLDLTGAGFWLTIAGATGPLDATWFNPLSGERIDAGSVDDGRHRFVPPWGLENWAVLHVRA